MIYLDNAATTKPCDEAKAAVMKGLNGKLELAEANDLIEAAKDGMTVMSGMTSEDDEDF